MCNNFDGIFQNFFVRIHHNFQALCEVLFLFAERFIFIGIFIVFWYGIFKLISCQKWQEIFGDIGPIIVSLLHQMRHHFEALELKHVQPAVAQIGSDFEIFTPKHNQNSEIVC